MIGVINRPQFDTGVFTPGAAIKFKYADKYTRKPQGHAIICQCTPLELTVGVMDNRHGAIVTVSIPLDNVVNGEVEISLLTSEKGGDE